MSNYDSPRLKITCRVYLRVYSARESTTGNIDLICRIFNFPGHIHQIEVTNGWRCQFRNMSTVLYYCAKVMMIINGLYDCKFLNIGSYYECLISHVYYVFFYLGYQFIHFCLFIISI